MNRKEQFSALRAEGLTYKAIAQRFGCSEQNVAQALSKENKNYFHPFSEKQVTFEGLRKWLNENRVTITELLRQKYGYINGGNSRYYMASRLNGSARMNMDDIEFFLKLTGKTYEELFNNANSAGETDEQRTN